MECDLLGVKILVCVGGRGYYQEWGKEAQELHPGDVVNIPVGVKHWHGAARIVGFPIWRLKFPAWMLLMNGWKQWMMLLMVV